MYKFTFIFRDEPNEDRIQQKVFNALAGIVQQDIREEIYKRGYNNGYRLGFHNGVQSGYREGKQFLANLPKDPLA